MNRTQTAIAIALVLGSLSATARAETLSEELSEANKEGRIWTSFALNPHLDALDLGIDVEGETAILTGTVPGAIERDLAAEVALGISGVKRVDNRIRIDPDWQRAPVADSQRSPADIAEDATITASVKSKLLWSARVDGMQVDVDTIDRRVTLSGAVDSAAARDMAGRLAADTLGVRAVDNRLKVDASLARPAADPVSDGWITARVKNSLLYSRRVDGLDIDVDTRAGVVNLKGSVSSPQERALAIELAENVNGVKRVDASGLRISG